MSQIRYTDYAKYLEARGRRTSIRVGKVLRSSPAEIARLLRFDEVLQLGDKPKFAPT